SDYDRRAYRQKQSIPDDALLVGYFGFLNASKGVENLIEAARIGIANGLNLHVLMIGGRTGSSDPTNSAYARRIETMISSAGLNLRFHWTGFVDDSHASGYLNACDLLALPFKDGVSFRRSSFMVGLAHGCAIITTTPTV